MTRSRRPSLLAFALALLASLLAWSTGGAATVASGTPGAAPDGWVSVIVKLEDQPVATYTGGVAGIAATSRLATGARRLDRSSSAVAAYRKHLARRMSSFESQVAAVVPGARVLHRFDVVVGGVALLVPESGVAALSLLPGVREVYPDERRDLQTTRSAALVGAKAAWQRLGGADDAGEGVVVGVIDTGVWPEHPSFADPDPSGKPYVAPPGTRVCAFSGGANPGAPFACNGKLIGAYRFLAAYDACASCPHSPEDFSSARDGGGHGTHTASTAVGNNGVRADLLGVAFGNASGIAPRAQVIAYKACGPADDGACFSSDSVAAIQQAILDGVDVINYSVGGGTVPYLDAVELAFRDAYAAGIFVAASAGNEGPDEDTVNHLGPWVTTVAASTQKRQFRSRVTLLAADDAKLQLAGASLASGLDHATQVVVAQSAGDGQCLVGVQDGAFAGKVVVCRRGGNARVEKSYNVGRRGALGMILIDDAAPGAQHGLTTDNHFVPTVHLASAGGLALLDFVAAHGGVTASFSAAAQAPAQGDVIAPFSSRGGAARTLGVLKPDLAAPGVQVLAGDTPAHWNPIFRDGELFQVMDGTSMAAPHVAGAAALLRHSHPDWSPGQIKSALMTGARTRKVMKEDGVTPFDAFDAGAGRIDVKRALDPGLTFDAPAQEFVAHQADLWAANQPSLFVPAGAPDELLVMRRARSELPVDSTWQLVVTAPQDLKIVVPPSITVAGDGGMTTFPISIDKRALPPGAVRHAALLLKHGSYRVRLPITVVGTVPLPNLVVTSVSSSSPVTYGGPVTLDATIRNVGPLAAGRFFVSFYVSVDGVYSFDDKYLAFCDFGSGLDAGATAACSGTLDFTPAGSVPPSTYRVILYADAGLEVAEGNEHDNFTATVGTVVVQ